MRHTSHWDRTKYLYTSVYDSLHAWSATCVVLATCIVGLMHLVLHVVSFMRGYTGDDSGIDGYRYRT